MGMPGQWFEEFQSVGGTAVTVTNIVADLPRGTTRRPVVRLEPAPMPRVNCREEPVSARVLMRPAGSTHVAPRFVKRTVPRKSVVGPHPWLRSFATVLR